MAWLSKRSISSRTHVYGKPFCGARRPQAASERAENSSILPAPSSSVCIARYFPMRKQALRHLPVRLCRFSTAGAGLFPKQTRSDRKERAKHVRPPAIREAPRAQPPVSGSLIYSIVSLGL
jgi:hypothetical protein